MRPKTSKIKESHPKSNGLVSGKKIPKWTEQQNEKEREKGERERENSLMKWNF